MGDSHFMVCAMRVCLACLMMIDGVYKPDFPPLRM